MSDTAIEQTTTNPKAAEWAERIAAQPRGGISVKQFCEERGVTEYSFYAWRKRLREKEPVRFALVEKRGPRQELRAEAVLELVLTTGERLCIGAGVDRATLRVVLDAFEGLPHLRKRATRERGRISPIWESCDFNWSRCETRALRSGEKWAWVT